jgi:shikimate dehydrogenase
LNTAQYGIIGWPLGHSKSPLLHNWGLKACKLPGSYAAWPTEPKKLKAFVAEVRARRIKGVSVTIPHKLAVIPLLDAITDRAKAVGAVNTLFWRGNALMGDNTDIAGIAAPLGPRLDRLSPALVLGAGGAARAACAALRGLNVADLCVSARDQAKAERLAEDFQARVVPWEERATQAWGLVLNATPLGMQGGNEALSPWPEEATGSMGLAFDLVYNPVRTRFLAQAEAAGAARVSGLSMFLHQGLAQFEIWTGQRLDEQRARQLLLADMLMTGG